MGGTAKLKNPQVGQAFDLQGPDSHALELHQTTGISPKPVRSERTVQRVFRHVVRRHEGHGVAMSRIIRFTGGTLALGFVSIAAVQQGAPPPPTSPANGYDVHVTAPHVVDGVPKGPYHHYCKVLNADPVMQCLVFASTAPDARLEQIEYVIAKSITRTGAVSLKDWNRNWHDHRQEVSTGRVQVHGLPPEQARQVADLMATTDGIIFHLWSHDERVPGGKVSIAQSVGHLHLSSEEFQAGAKEVPLPK